MITIVFPIMYYHNITNQVCGACHRKWDQVVRLESSNALELNQVFCPRWGVGGTYISFTQVFKSLGGERGDWIKKQVLKSKFTSDHKSTSNL